MKNLQKMGGVAALYEAAAYLIALVGYLLVVGTMDVVDPVEKVSTLVNNQAFLYILNLIAYIFWGFFQIALALALYERLKVGSPALVQTATGIGLVWACVIIASGMISNVGMATVVDLYAKDPQQAATVWLAIESVANGLSGASGETLGGTWVLLSSLVALRVGELPKVLNYFGVVLGLAGLLSTVPSLFMPVVFVFALGKIVWLIGLGIVMLRSRTSAIA
ncbi:MAG TPA: DUF4386 family protein [Anaerolineales bacterium]